MKQYRLLSCTNKLITINRQQFLLYSERIVIIYRKLIIELDQERLFSPGWIRDAVFLHTMKLP